MQRHSEEWAAKKNAQMSHSVCIKCEWMCVYMYLIQHQQWNYFTFHLINKVNSPQLINMPARRGLLAPQNNFLETIATRFDGTRKLFFLFIFLVHLTRCVYIIHWKYCDTWLHVITTQERGREVTHLILFTFVLLSNNCSIILRTHETKSSRLLFDCNSSVHSRASCSLQSHVCSLFFLLFHLKNLLCIDYDAFICAQSFISSLCLSTYMTKRTRNNLSLPIVYHTHTHTHKCGHVGQWIFQWNSTFPSPPHPLV